MKAIELIEEEIKQIKQSWKYASEMERDKHSDIRDLQTALKILKENRVLK